MLAVPDLIAWLNTLAPTSLVAIDEGGVRLDALTPSGHTTGAYLELGGYDPTTATSQRSDRPGSPTS
ncbi:hypothetical protein [Nocardia puris]|uniref:hypothetical protein n=1 Tax=Nocardia puris TaxID=208602 RepID=UPI002E1BED40